MDNVSRYRHALSLKALKESVVLTTNELSEAGNPFEHSALSGLLYHVDDICRRYAQDRHGEFEIEFCVSCLGYELTRLSVSKAGIITKSIFIELAGIGALLSRLPCGSQKFILPSDETTWQAELPSNVVEHIGVIYEEVVKIISGISAVSCRQR